MNITFRRRVAVLGAACCASLWLTLTLTTAAAGPSPTTTFTSKTYAYSIVLSGGSDSYLLTPARISWSGGTPTAGVDPAYDQINDLEDHSEYRFAAKSLPSGWTLRRWTSFTVSITDPPCHYEPQTLTKSTLARTPAFLYEETCAEGTVFQLAAIHADRGYLVIYLGDSPARHAFVAALRSFRFAEPRRP